VIKSIFSMRTNQAKKKLEKYATLLQSVALKVMYSAISLSCLRYSSMYLGENSTYLGNGLIQNVSVQNASGTGESIDYAMFIGQGSKITCPTTSGIMIAGTSSTEVTTEKGQEGLGEYSIALPTHFIALSTADIEEYGNGWLTVEAVNGNDKTHCGSNVFSTPATLSSGFYKCCARKDNIRVLAESHSFADFMMFAAFVCISLVCLPVEFLLFRKMIVKKRKEECKLPASSRVRGLRI